MATQQDEVFRPYAPPANVVAVLQRLRRMNTPPRVTREFLRGAEITESLVPRVVATLRFLELTNEADEPTDTLRALVTGTEEEYRELLGQVLRTAYAEDFENVDPSTDPQDRIINAFQRYTPRSQHQRQVMLFLGLCREAGIATADAPRERGLRGTYARSARAGAPGGARQPRQQPPTPPGGGAGQQEQAAEQFLGITMEDAALMPEQEFRDVWQALGKMFRLRALRQHSDRLRQGQEEPGQAEEHGEDEIDGGDAS